MQRKKTATAQGNNSFTESLNQTNFPCFFSSLFYYNSSILLKGNESWRVGSSNTGATVLDRLVGDAELTEIMANHLRLKTTSISHTLCSYRTMHIINEIFFSPNETLVFALSHNFSPWSPPGWRSCRCKHQQCFRSFRGRWSCHEDGSLHTITETRLQ